MLESLLSLDNLFTLAMLTFLQIVLGFDNLLYISLESQRVVPEEQARVRKMGIGVAIVLRILLLFLVLGAIQSFQDPFYTFHMPGILEGRLTIHSLIVLLGGVFIIYTAFKEIYHMLGAPDIDQHGSQGQHTRSFGSALFWIVAMNLVFSFDSILSAVALTKVFWVMATAIVISGALMIWMADYVSEFLKKNRMYEVLGLFILFIVGIMLVSEGGHLAHLHFFGFPVEPMAKTTFYFVICTLVVVDIVQTRYQRKILAEQERVSQVGDRSGGQA